MFPELPEKPLLFPFRMLYLQGRLIKTGKVVGEIIQEYTDRFHGWVEVHIIQQWQGEIPALQAK